MTDHGGHGGGGGRNNIGNSTEMGDGSITIIMNMFFHFGKSETILFEFWKTNDIGSLFGSVALIFLLGIACEAIKFYREYLRRAHFKSVSNNTVIVPLENGGGDGQAKDIQNPNILRLKMFSRTHATQTLLHVIQLVISYLLMLIVMTYNVWLCTAVILGAGVGYFLFGWQRTVIIGVTEHC